MGHVEQHIFDWGDVRHGVLLNSTAKALSKKIEEGSQDLKYL
jgi:hypothetical protein